MKKYFKQVYCNEVGKNPEHRYPKLNGWYNTNEGLRLWTNAHFTEDTSTSMSKYPIYWLEEVELSMFEYDWYPLNGSPSINKIELNKMGLKGWELICIKGCIAYFKREITTNNPKP